MLLVNLDADQASISTEISSKLKHKISSNFVMVASSEPFSFEESEFYQEIGTDLFLSIGSYSKTQRCWKVGLEAAPTTK